MKKVRLLGLGFIVTFLIIHVNAQVSDPVDYVSTLVGTNSKYELSTGNTYPAIALPWGMNFWSPQTGKMGDGWMYTYTADKIRGFKQTHQPSPWMNDYGQFSIMPVTGKIVFDEDERASWFSHKAEVARPFYYKVHLADHDVTTEITPTERAAIFRFTFPNNRNSSVVIDAFDEGSFVKIIPEEKKIVGYTTRNSGGVPENFKNYFVIVFDKAFAGFSIVQDGRIIESGKEFSGNHAGAIIRFATSNDERVHARVASSFISEAQALINLKELGDGDFDKIAGKGRQRWSDVLGKIKVEDDNIDNIRTFYSSFYRSVLFPRNFSEVDATGKIVHYSPYNGQVLPGHMYTDTGFWDTFRSLFPFLNFLFPSENVKMQEGLANAYKESGFLPEWASPGHRDIMVGNNSASVVADAYLKGLRGYDIETLWEALKHGANNVHPQVSASGRRGYDLYNKHGFIPNDVDVDQNVARSLEYAYDDWTIYRLGKELNKPREEIEVYAKRALNYKNLYNSKRKLMTGRATDGSFSNLFNPADWGRDFTEGNSWHYSWSVFHDPQGLIDLMGGQKEFVNMLDSVFIIPGAKGMESRSMIHEMREMQVMDMGQYAHGNQPIQHMVYLYNYAGEPWKAQYWAREIMDKLYASTPDGYCGDEDNGQTSAWYVFSALGFYPVCPGSNEYVLGSPLFKSVEINLDNGKKITITSDDNSKSNRYVSVMKLNGKKYSKNFVSHNDLMKGAKIKFKMSAAPNKDRGIEKNDSHILSQMKSKTEQIRSMIGTWMNRMLAIVATLIALYSCAPKEEAGQSFRAPAYPLITIDPYTSAWSTSDQLFDSPVKHWTGRNHSLIGAVRVDGQAYRFMGKEEIPLQPVLPNAKHEAWEGKFMNEAPAKGWEKPGFNDASWKSGKAGFGTPNTFDTKTPWETKEIWVRRTFTLPPSDNDAEFFLNYSHDDDFEMYLNGTEIVNTGNQAKNNVTVKLDKSLLSSDGNNVIAVHCLDRGGLAYVDFGILKESEQKPIFSQTAVQKNVKITATQTKYDFTCGPVDLHLEFASPLLMDDLDLLSRPVNYVSYEVSSNDGQSHEVEVYFETTPEWAVNESNQQVEVTTGETGNVKFIKTGTTEQAILKKKGDNVRIDWGYFYIATDASENSRLSIGEFSAAKKSFMADGVVNPANSKVTSVMTNAMPALAYTDKLGAVSSKGSKGHFMLAYDDIESIQYFGENLKAWWTKDGEVSFDKALTSAAAGYEKVIDRCDKFDDKLYREAFKAGGENYARLCLLAYRQSIAAHKLVKDKQGNTLFLSKENFSNGSIGTVDVTYPSAPLFLKYNPELLKGMLNPIFYYTESGKWNKPFAAHDVGTYPQANGQTYGGDMPVEESGNMLILTTAIAKVEGNAAYAEKHWEALTTWANYLLEKGLDPENQLCTDDFAGHFAHNINLSAKAIMGIAGYGKLADMLGKKDVADKYTAEAKRMAQEWVKMANDGDHFRLTFDQSGTWSQKYNLVWDKLLDLGIFPKEVMEKEVAYYLTKQNKYGLPLDNRRTYTKSDWIIWTATLANDTATFQKFIDPIYGYVTETPDRVPMSDWYETTDAKQVGFQARSVVGGYFIKLLEK